MKRRNHGAQRVARASPSGAGLAIPIIAPAQPLLRTYARRRPEATALYDVVRDNLETLYGAVDDGALAVKVPKAREEEARRVPRL